MGDLGAEQVKQLKEAFSLFDKNGDGKLTIVEFESVLKSLGFLNDGEIKNHIKSAAKDNQIDFPSFLTVMTKHLKGDAPIEEIQEAFRVFDHNNNGHINAEEFKKLMTSGTGFTATDIEEILKDAEIDDDGDFDYESFVQKIAKSR
ncbi:calmodulin [Acrasis kona]|uniref:Calmodulin n=1 Tax=Acrasis kona TaxID=1008807 RepID=A0AAW2ZIZ4_9EUKA